MEAEQELQVRQTAQAIVFRHLLVGDEENPVDTFWSGINLDLTGALLGPANLIGCRIVAADFTGATFTGDLWFSRARFGLDAVFTGTRFAGEASFSEARFDDSALFDGVTFDNWARFKTPISAGPRGSGARNAARARRVSSPPRRSPARPGSTRHGSPDEGCSAAHTSPRTSTSPARNSLRKPISIKPGSPVRTTSSATPRSPGPISAQPSSAATSTSPVRRPRAAPRVRAVLTFWIRE